MDSPDQRRDIRGADHLSPSERHVRRYGSVRIPAVLAALPFWGAERPCPKAEERRRAFYQSGRFLPTASD